MNEVKKKAIELVGRFVYSDKKEFPRLKTKNQAKKDALICVDEIISANPTIIGYDEMSDGSKEIWYVYNVIFWQQVKEEINKI